MEVGEVINDLVFTVEQGGEPAHRIRIIRPPDEEEHILTAGGIGVLSLCPLLIPFHALEFKVDAELAEVHLVKLER